ncbi:MAG: hypothetical protein R3C69_10570 [Geminicoccaceae bacterium]
MFPSASISRAGGPAPKLAVAANGQGQTSLWPGRTTAQVRRQLPDLTDVATYLGERYGGWYPLAERYGTHEGK